MNASMNLLEAILIDPAVCHGKPIIPWKRVPVSIIFRSVPGGMSLDHIEHEYGVTGEEINAALAFANDLVQQESLHGLPRATL